MKMPFSIKELDDLLNACINFTVQHEPYFYWGNVGGADGVTTDSDAVTRMLSWLARTDEQLIEDCGHAQDNIRYFRLGVAAPRVMRTGGVGPYFRARSRRELMERVRLWAPISISLAALIVSIFVLEKPAANPADVQSLRAQLATMQSEQTRLESAVIQLAKPPGSTGQGNGKGKLPSATPADAAPRGQTL